mmetsp:Transcript_106547/g.301339  ORF Transcript_106547/g.301339 Transcript_106547/m.301339 type:complete len:270 (+) Transcript_106547:78-887(+)
MQRPLPTGSPRVRGAPRVRLEALLGPHRVAPEVVQGQRLADVEGLAVARRDLDPVERAAVAVEADGEALHDERLRFLHGEVRAPLVAQERHRQVRAKACCDEVLFKGRPLVIDEGELRPTILLLARHHELVVQRVHLAAAVVHHAADVRRVFMRPHAAAVLVEEVFVVEIIEHIPDVLEVAQFAAGSKEGVLPNLLEAADVLVPGLRSVRGQRVGCDHDSAAVLHPDDGCPRHDRLERVLGWVGGILPGSHRPGGRNDLGRLGSRQGRP